MLCGLCMLWFSQHHMKSKNQSPLKNGMVKSSQKSLGNRSKMAIIVRILITLVSNRSNTSDRCGRTNREPEQSQITLPQSQLMETVQHL